MDLVLIDNQRYVGIEFEIAKGYHRPIDQRCDLFSRIPSPRMDLEELMWLEGDSSAD